MIRVPGDFEHDGRLGNQLFQIAATVGIAKTLGTAPSIPRDWSYRRWFSLPEEWYAAPIGAVTADFFAQHLPAPYRLYLQDPSLWLDVADEIRAAFQPSELALKEIPYRSGGVVNLSVHVRRGDNLTNDPGTIEALPFSYYEDACRMMGGMYDTAWAFSDDPEWCRENLVGLVHYVFDESQPRPKEHAPDYMTAPITDWMDVFLMARCDAHIISNSSYAWWGAWLADSKRVIYPSYWYGEQLTDVGADPSLLFKGLDWQMLETQPERLSC